MASGFRRTGFDVLAHGAGAPRADARALLASLSPLLVDDPPAAVPAWVEVVDGRAEYRLREALADEGVPLVDPGASGAAAVVLVDGAAAARRFAAWLRADVRHLPVSFEPGRVVVGPLVTPGDTPCLSCRDAHERERDPAWPRLHAQLIGRRTGYLRAARVAAALVLRGPAGTMATVTEDGARSCRRVSFHEECRCRDLSSRSRRGSATVPAPPAPPIATTTATATARPG